MFYRSLTECSHEELLVTGILFSIIIIIVVTIIEVGKNNDELQKLKMRIQKEEHELIRNLTEAPLTEETKNIMIAVIKRQIDFRNALLKD